MANTTSISLHTLPADLVYRILDNLDGSVIFLSLQNVSTRLNEIIDTYQPYKVKFYFVLDILKL